ncbi:hypothetical protein COU60_02900 [Candidatus Pacearchaeota archaeon CG10_big_fil_rev_8_21_14_0_10_34_76]|nr:MAG: hypothetical protein COU60_02900 [Candidatus Pacearchaeota archaeon CG10_big_fil_rev_8_21_14_0_10_34_76]
MNKEITIGEKFLTEFVKRISELSKKDFPASSPISPISNEFSEYNISPPIVEPEIQTISPPIHNQSYPISAPPLPVKEISQKFIAPKQSTPPNIPIVRPKQGYIDLGKLNMLINDPWIQSIECSGPDKKVTVKKGAKILMTSISLPETEIKTILESFSRATRIPIAEGTIKAMHNNLMITGVISEFVGSRFIIQKVTPPTWPARSKGH